MDLNKMPSATAAGLPPEEIETVSNTCLVGIYLSIYLGVYIVSCTRVIHSWSFFFPFLLGRWSQFTQRGEGDVVSGAEVGRDDHMTNELAGNCG